VFDIVLYQPEIPPNTGNVLRLCANTGCRLHLVEPLGFLLTDRALERAGLDYGDISDIKVHTDWAACRARFRDQRIFAFSTRARLTYTAVRFGASDVFLFGSETRGLPADVMSQVDSARLLRLPMRPGSRSMNLSNAVAVVVFEAWRQIGFSGALTPDG
jgi:tRNA (cytidine/uridine-2'-O-)-methyltransferase